MKNLKLGSKLLISFSVVLFLMLVSFLVSFFCMTSMNREVKDFSAVVVPNTSNALTMKIKLEEIEKKLLLAVTADDFADTQQMLQEVSRLSSDVKNLMDAYGETGRASAEQIDTFRRMMEDVKDSRAKVLDLLRQNNETADSEALSLLKSDYEPKMVSAVNQLNAICTEENNHSQNQAAESGKVYIRVLCALAGILVFSLALTIFIGRSLRRNILNSVGDLQHLAEEMGKGNLKAVSTNDARDELGSLCRRMQSTMEILSSYVDDIGRMLSQVSEGDLDIQASKPFVGDFSAIENSLMNFSGSLSATLCQINQSAEQVTGGAEQVSIGAQSLSQGASEQASSVEELSATMSEISSQIKDNAANAETVNLLSGEVHQEILKGNQQMKKMISAMEEISDTSREISKIIKAIDDIAFQTNILALNAAVEAARAGSAGKGFAVVADEVRNLAQKSADSAKDTAVLIENSMRAVENGRRIAKNTADSLENIVVGASETTELIHNIAQVSNAQAEAAGQVNVGIDQISAVVQTNSATAEESAAASQELSSQAQILKQMISGFHLKHTAGGEGQT